MRTVQSASPASGDAEVSAVRDCFRVEDKDGNRFCLFRQGDSMDPATGSLRWFLHAMV